MKTIAALFLVAALTGCGPAPDTDECGYKWVKDRPPIAPENVTVHRVPDVFLYCNFDAKALACSRADYGASPPAADIYIPSYVPPGAESCKTPVFLEAHERRHVEQGEQHPGQLHQMRF